MLEAPGIRMVFYLSTPSAPQTLYLACLTDYRDTSLSLSGSSAIVCRPDRTEGPRRVVQNEMYVTDRRPRASQLAYGQSPRCSTERPRDHTVYAGPKQTK